MPRIIYILALLTALAEAGNPLTVGDIIPEIQEALARGESVITTRAGKFTYSLRDAKSEFLAVKNSNIGVQVKNFDKTAEMAIRKWVEKKNPKVVTVVTPRDLSAKSFLSIAAPLNELGVPYTCSDVSIVQGKVVTQFTLFDGLYSRISFTRPFDPSINIPKHKNLPNKSRHPTPDTPRLALFRTSKP